MSRTGTGTTSGDATTSSDDTTSGDVCKPISLSQTYPGILKNKDKNLLLALQQFSLKLDEYLRCDMCELLKDERFLQALLYICICKDRAIVQDIRMEYAPQVFQGWKSSTKGARKCVDFASAPSLVKTDAPDQPLHWALEMKRAHAAPHALITDLFRLTALHFHGTIRHSVGSQRCYFLVCGTKEEFEQNDELKKWPAEPNNTKGIKFSQQILKTHFSDTLTSPKGFNDAPNGCLLDLQFAEKRCSFELRVYHVGTPDVVEIAGNWKVRNDHQPSASSPASSSNQSGLSAPSTK
eukprot:CAMPEP_0201547180 /NCGR_PEP_ID=MMETSP0173_2-20130828/3610_1 /ASSEMBLY_ACC=CAM_ASM_000268 /TAXON_ID=218659 /ORGANISM="Vexillifera sp., Strain DIVA3 564/2" /LENGTH=293 /DNA_ID=CAMNT_0047956139 /DNA_START=11 /DNA_END=892 /DNA_ORIENTATION=-